MAQQSGFAWFRNIITFFFLTDPREVVECFSSPLIPYGIQSVKIKIRRNRGIFDRSLQKEGPIEKEIIQNRKKFFSNLIVYLSLIPKFP